MSWTNRTIPAPPTYSNRNEFLAIDNGDLLLTDEGFILLTGVSVPIFTNRVKPTTVWS